MIKSFFCFMFFTFFINFYSYADEEIIDVPALTDPNVFIEDLEFDYESNKRMLWHDNKGMLWLAWVDPNDGTIIPDDAKLRLLDIWVAPPQLHGNGAEWVYGEEGSFIVYNNFNKEIIALKDVDEGWQHVDLPGDIGDRILPIGTPPGPHSAKIAYYYIPPEGGNMELRVRELFSEEEWIIPEARNVRWYDGDRFVTAVPVDGVMQSALLEFSTRTKTVLTDNPGFKNYSRIMYVPDMDTYVLFCVANWDELQMWVPKRGKWVLLNSIKAPNPDRPNMRVPEPFIYKGKGYVTFVCSEIRNWVTGNASDVWLAAVDPANFFIRRVSRENAEDKFLIDPEHYIANDEAYIFYGELLPNGKYTMRKANTGL